MGIIKQAKTVFILSASSDIGYELARRYLDEGYKIVGTYRDVGKLDKLLHHPNAYFILCDINRKKDINRLKNTLKKKKIIWDIFISCVGDLSPVGLFFSLDFDSWNKSLLINSLEQLRVLHGIYKLRNTKLETNVIFFAGGGTNNSVTDLSAYTLGKIMLTKFCELMNTENNDMNFFIVGPGWTKTKIHKEILNSQVKGKKLEETKKFLKSGRGTEFEDIYNCINWLIKKGKKVSGGRNFSVVSDEWRGRNAHCLAKELEADINMYKLRRFKNEWKSKLLS